MSARLRLCEYKTAAVVCTEANKAAQLIYVSSEPHRAYPGQPTTVHPSTRMSALCYPQEPSSITCDCLCHLERWVTFHVMLTMLASGGSIRTPVTARCVLMLAQAPYYCTSSFSSQRLPIARHHVTKPPGGETCPAVMRSLIDGAVRPP